MSVIAHELAIECFGFLLHISDRMTLQGVMAMTAILKLFDEHFGPNAPERRAGGELRLASQQVTPREIIARRVEGEIDNINAESEVQAQAFSQTRSFLVRTEPGTAEDTLNPVRAPRRLRPKLDPVAETARAVEAFERRSFIMLVDDRQIDGLDQHVGLMLHSEVIFLYLTPLKGG